MRSKIGRETRFDARGLFAAAMCGWLAASCSPTKFEEYRFQPGVQIESSGALTTTEAGGEATFTVRLQSAPKRPVVVDVASSDSGEGVVDPPQLMFGPDDWETPKTVRIRGVDDGVGDGDQAFTISFVVVSEDHAYEGLAVDPLHALNREVPSVVVGDPTPLFTTEDGATARFEIRLAAPPTANVVIDVQVSDGSEISAAPSSLTFSPSNWSTSVAVTLTGLDDALFDGDQRLQIQFTVSSADARYEKLSVEPIPMANFDDEPTVVSVSTSGAPGDNGGSEGYSISDDGRLIAFISGSTNLVPDDTNGTDDVFVHDRLTGQTSRVSMTVEGQQLASDAFYPTISGDGMHVIYTTRRDPAVPKVHLYVHHRATGKTELVSGEFDYAYSGGPSDLSDDGRFVAFVSPPTPGWWMSVHVRDMQTGVVTLVSHRLDGSPNTAAAMWPRIQGSGESIVYHSEDMMIGGVTGADSQIFYWRARDGVNYMVGKSGAVPGFSNSFCPVIADDAQGTVMVFYSGDPDVVANDANNVADVFVMPGIGGTPTAISRGPSGATGNGQSWIPDISDDGRYVVFESSASNLVTMDTNGDPDAFFFDRNTNAMSGLTIASANGAYAPRISGSGRFVVVGALDGLVPGDTNSKFDVIVMGVP